jgi:TonB family protein
MMIPLLAVVIAASPSPSPTAAASNCEADAHVLNAVEPAPASSLTHLEEAVTVSVLVKIAASGNVESVTIYQSGGHPELDKATIEAARQSSYVPKIHDCKPVEGSMVFSSTFAPF